MCQVVSFTPTALLPWGTVTTVAVRKHDCPSKCDDCCLLTVMWIGSHLRTSQKLVGGISNGEWTIPLKHMLTLSRIVSSRIIAYVSSWWVNTQIKHFSQSWYDTFNQLTNSECALSAKVTLLCQPALSTFTVSAVCSLKQCSECREPSEPAHLKAEWDNSPSPLSRHLMVRK